MKMGHVIEVWRALPPMRWLPVYVSPLIEFRARGRPARADRVPLVVRLGHVFVDRPDLLDQDRQEGEEE
jgi:hypothetical protein